MTHTTRHSVNTKPGKASRQRRVQPLQYRTLLFNFLYEANKGALLPDGNRAVLSLNNITCGNFRLALNLHLKMFKGCATIANIKKTLNNRSRREQYSEHFKCNLNLNIQRLCWKRLLCSTVQSRNAVFIATTLYSETGDQMATQSRFVHLHPVCTNAYTLHYVIASERSQRPSALHCTALHCSSSSSSSALVLRSL